MISNNYFLYLRYSHTCAVFQSALHENRPVVAVTGGSGSPSYTRIVEILDYTTENPQWTLRKYLKLDLGAVLKGRPQFLVGRGYPIADVCQLYTANVLTIKTVKIAGKPCNSYSPFP